MARFSILAAIFVGALQPALSVVRGRCGPDLEAVVAAISGAA